MPWDLHGFVQDFFENVCTAVLSAKLCRTVEKLTYSEAQGLADRRSAFRRFSTRTRSRSEAKSRAILESHPRRRGALWTQNLSLPRCSYRQALAGAAGLGYWPPWRRARPRLVKGLARTSAFTSAKALSCSLPKICNFLGRL